MCLTSPISSLVVVVVMVVVAVAGMVVMVVEAAAAGVDVGEVVVVEWEVSMGEASVGRSTQPR